MRKSLFPISVWAYRGKTLQLFNFCQSVKEALSCAKKLPFTPLVLCTQQDLPFLEEFISKEEFGLEESRLRIP
jgi:hypothetical protein